MTTTRSPFVDGDGGFRVVRVFHPSAHAPDLDEAERFFEDTFGRTSTPLAELARGRPANPDYPLDYSTFTTIRDVFFDTVNPDRLLVGGKQQYPSVAVPRLKTIGWYIDGTDELYRALRRHDIDVTDLTDQVLDGDDPPAPVGGRAATFFASPASAGLRYQFFPEGPFPLDPRTTPGWQLGPVEADDPLGLEFCSHHTILTDRPERALRLVVGALGGEVIHEGRDDLLGATSTYVALADGVLEYAVPGPDNAARADLDEHDGLDSYYSITWKVADLDRAEQHLLANGIAVQNRTDTGLVTDPSTSMGVAWGFTNSLTPGDPRS